MKLLSDILRRDNKARGYRWYCFILLLWLMLYQQPANVKYHADIIAEKISFASISSRFYRDCNYGYEGYVGRAFL